MSLEFMASERVGYVHCNFCKTVLAVIVPYSSLYAIGTVRCGHCANLLSVNMEHFLQVFPLQNSQQQQLSPGGSSTDGGGGSSSKSINVAAFGSQDHEPQPPRLAPIRPPEKRQRVPSAYNRFIKEEIQRIKAGNPEITHREAFSTAAKNWAHFPHIHFGSKTTMIDGSKQGKLDHSLAGEGMMNKKAKSNAFY